MVFAGIAPIKEDEVIERFALDLRQTFGQGSGLSKSLHFAKLSGAKKLPAFMQLATAPMLVFVVATDTSIMRSKPSAPHEAQNRYRFALRFLLERASWLAARRRQPLEMVIEESAHITVDSMREYVDRLYKGHESEPRSVDVEWGWVDKDRITMARKEEQPQLWLADGVAHAFFQALEANSFIGRPVPIYADLLQPLLWRGPRGDQISRNGFTFIPPARTADFMREFPIVRRWVIQHEQVAAALWQQRSDSDPLDGNSA